MGLMSLRFANIAPTQDPRYIRCVRCRQDEAIKKARAAVDLVPSPCENRVAATDLDGELLLNKLFIDDENEGAGDNYNDSSGSADDLDVSLASLMRKHDGHPKS